MLFFGGVGSGGSNGRGGSGSRGVVGGSYGPGKYDGGSDTPVGNLSNGGVEDVGDAV